MHNQKVVDAIQAVLEKKATKDQLSYSIEGRSVPSYSHDELYRLLIKYEARVRRTNGRRATATRDYLRQPFNDLAL